MLTATYPTQSEFDQAKEYAKTELTKLLDINLRDKNPKLDEIVARLCFGQKNGYQPIVANWKNGGHAATEENIYILTRSFYSHDPEDDFVETFTSSSRDGLFNQAYNAFCSDWAYEYFFSDLLAELDWDNPDIFLETFEQLVETLPLSNGVTADTMNAARHVIKSKMEPEEVTQWYEENLTEVIEMDFMDLLFTDLSEQFFVELYIDFWSDEERIEIEHKKIKKD